MQCSFGWDRSLNRDGGWCRFDSLDEAVRGARAPHAIPRVLRACDLPFHEIIAMLRRNQYAYATSYHCKHIQVTDTFENAIVMAICPEIP